jgi:hypothetical protein
MAWTPPLKILTIRCAEAVESVAAEFCWTHQKCNCPVILHCFFAGTQALKFAYSGEVYIYFLWLLSYDAGVVINWLSSFSRGRR